MEGEDQGSGSRRTKGSSSRGSRRDRRAKGEKGEERSSRKRPAQKYGSQQGCWVTMLMMCSLIFVNGTMFLTFSQVDELCVQHVYDVVGVLAAEYLCLVFLIMYPIGSILANLITINHGMRQCVVTGGVLTALGIFLRVMSTFPAMGGKAEGGYDCLLIGEVFAGMAQPMLMNNILKLANYWFDSKERDWATKYMYMSQPVGLAFGLIISAIITHRKCDQNLLAWIYLTELFLAIAATGWAYLKFKSKPARPPSRSNEQMIKTTQDHLKKASLPNFMLKETLWVLKNPNFIFLMLSFAFLMSLIYGLLAAAAVDTLIIDYNFSRKDMVLFLSVTAAGGMFGIYVYGGFLAVMPSYHPMRKIGYLLSIPTVLFFDWWLDDSTAKCGTVGFFVLGMTLLPLLPITLETAAEITYDVPFEFVSGIMFSFGYLFTIGTYFMMTKIPPAKIDFFMLTPWYKLICLCLAGAAASFSILAFGKYNRRHVDEYGSADRGVTKPLMADAEGNATSEV
uniref:Major facilitator superfamily (MFS) profile domain-containing protein n=1 Tax=Fibrocapsa japonica TaxID=94617 RepID=A0A7S2Y066_9STRA|mmetsp:Transcript_1805/g.2515  ORF Transcript_1805/g.2515 Transcript_1805/m.2515 type:complete len:508 (+) Transcript_1805:116-1639(+)|eukprot:CAMPEP_0113934896 /NCGR_PEP_ID=MMETSP1339-20121228/2141_1 /TAXON_ID=94617 /ORGANISM="Fibrocapsa japonica" /LENGTH=507 /DNA_ID=CAMNT_0000936853 /DNA_START=107 /DNA_END=1630 /DNA_ORIENTATION=- /assembly_acc=CAM_ASM_000762